MGRFGPVLARFYSPDDLTTPLNNGGAYRVAVEATSSDYVGEMGNSQLKFVHDDGLTTMAAAGNICWAVKTDAMRTDLPGNEVTFAEPFIIARRDISAEPGFLLISGPSLLNELTHRIISRPLGLETVYNTTLLVAALGPNTSRTLTAGAPPGVDSFRVSSAESGDVGRELRVKMDNNIWFVSVITEVREWAGSKYLVTKDRIPSPATMGNDIETRTRKIRVTTPDNLAVGQEITITLDSGTHKTLIEEGPTGDAGNEIRLRDGLTGAANKDNAVVVKDYSNATTNDVTLAMEFMPAWSVEFETGTGTAAGTRYPGGRETVYDVLRSIADETGEQFRLKSAEASPTGPKRRVYWRRTTDNAGVGGVVRLVMPTTQSDMNTASGNVNRAIMIERPSHVGVYDAISHIVPIAGDATVTLFGCSSEAVAAAALAGFTVVTTGLSLYAMPYVINNAQQSAIGVVQRVVTFSEVTVEGDNTTSITAAADRLLALSINYLREHVRTAKEIVARCISPVGIRSGQAVELYFESPTGDYTIDYTSPALLYVQSVNRTELPGDDPNYPGAPVTTLTLTPTRQAISTPAGTIGRKLAAVDRLMTKVASPRLINAAIAIGSGGDAPPPPPVAGVYLPLEGGTMTGNIGFSGAQTVDGVDISAHAADPAAHHAPVTAGNSGISVTGQAVSAAVNSSGGLEINSGLQAKLPSDSGLTRDSTGLYLAPGTLTAATTNAVSGASHTHAVTTTANAKATPSTVLQGDSSGDLTTRYFTADKVTTPQVDTSAGNLTLKPAGSLNINPTGNTAELLSATTLKTNHWSSGFLGTGWGVTYAGAADFRSVTADELHAQAFIADTARVKVGSEYITPSMGLVSRAFVIPAVGSTGTLYVEDAPGLDDLPLFVDDDWVLLRIMNRAGGGLNVLNVWGQVTGYTDLSGGEQSWAFKTRNATLAAQGKTAQRGSVALGYGKSGDGWLWMTAIDPAGSPYLGMATWRGSDPYTPANRADHVRLGQLAGLTGVTEYGLGFGTSSTNGVVLSNTRSEIRGTGLSLYASRGGSLQLAAIAVQHYRTGSLFSTLAPDSDALLAQRGLRSTAATFYTEIDETVGLPNHNDYVANTPGGSGMFYVGLQNPTWNGNTVQVKINAAIKTVGFSGDTVKLYGQLFAGDTMTALTSEVLIYTATTNTTTSVMVDAPLKRNTPTQAQWNAAWLRLRWEYIIGDTAYEAIRLDPDTPSIAVGYPLPTGYDAGGDGFWVGRDAGVYKMRLGKASGVGLRWDGSMLAIRNSDNLNVIELKSDGTSSFARPLSLGTNGGIWQASGGTFASPTSGLKIWNDSGEGRLALFDSSGAQRITLRHDRGIEIANAGPVVNSAAITFAETAGATPFGGIYITKADTVNQAILAVIDSGGGATGILAERSSWAAEVRMSTGGVRLKLNSSDKFLLLTAADSYPSFYVNRGGIGVGYDPYSLPAIPVGVIALNLDGKSDNPQIVLQDTTDIAHGMTDIASTSTYANFAKLNNSDGGLLIRGLTETVVGLNLAGYGTTTNTATSTAATAAVHVSAFKKSGTGTTSYGSSDNIFVVRNNLNTRFIVKGNGDFHYDGTGSAFDDHDDVGLLRTLSREMWSGTIDSVWDKFITTNRQNLIDAGIISDGGFINGAALNRLLTGAIWQLSERLAALEGRAHHDDGTN